MSGANNELLLFQNFTSSADVSFWKELARRKLDELGLDDTPIPITGSFRVSPGRLVQDAANSASPPILFDLSEASYGLGVESGGEDAKAEEQNSGSSSNNNTGAGGGGASASSDGDNADRLPVIPDVLEAARLPGALINFNTVEAFKKADKNALLEDCMCRQLSLAPEDRFSDSLPRFVVICYADLKRHMFIYWVGFPTLRVERSMLPSIAASGSTGVRPSLRALASFVPDEAERKNIANQLRSLAAPPRPGTGVGAGRWALPLYFAMVCSVDAEGSATACECHPISVLPKLARTLATDAGNQKLLCLGCIDPSTTSHSASSSWPVRNLLSLVQLAGITWPGPRGVPSATSGAVVRVVCVRDRISPDSQLGSSTIVDVQLPELPVEVRGAPQFFGWEADKKGRARPRKVSLASQASTQKTRCCHQNYR